VKASGALAGLLLVAAAAMSYRLDDPWMGKHAYASAQTARIARHHLEDCLGVTRLASVLRVDRQSGRPGVVYAHRPPGFPLVLAGAFYVFGARESVARATMIFVALLSVICLDRLVLRLFDRPTAWLASMLLALAPAMLYGGRIVSLTHPVLLWILASVLGYMRWLNSRRGLDFALLVTVMSAGMLTNWQAYYLSAILPAHFLLFERSRRGSGRVLILGLLAPLWFALLVGHLLLVSPTAWNEITGVFRFRAGLMSVDEQLAFYDAVAEYSFGGLLLALAKHAFRWLTLPLIIATLAGAGVWLRRWKQAPADRGRLAIVGMLLAPAALHTMLFHNTMYVHDYLIVLFLPGIAVLGALGLMWLWRRHTLGTRALSAVLMLAFAAQSSAETYRFHMLEFPEPVVVGMELAKALPANNPVVVIGLPYHPAVEWYARREVNFVDRDGPLETQRGRQPRSVAVVKWPREWLQGLRKDRSDRAAERFVERTQAAMRYVAKHGRRCGETRNLWLYTLPPPGEKQ